MYSKAHVLGAKQYSGAEITSIRIIGALIHGLVNVNCIIYTVVIFNNQYNTTQSGKLNRRIGHPTAEPANANGSSRVPASRKPRWAPLQAAPAWSYIFLATCFLCRTIYVILGLCRAEMQAECFFYGLWQSGLWHGNPLRFYGLSPLKSFYRFDP